MRIRIFLQLVLVLGLSVFALAPAVAADDVVAFTEGESETETAEEPTGSELGIEPAVTVPPEAVEETELPWTQRYLAPAVGLLGALAVIGAIAYYGARIRSRYEVVG